MSSASPPVELLYVARGRSRLWLAVPPLGGILMPLVPLLVALSLRRADDAGFFKVMPSLHPFVIMTFLAFASFAVAAFAFERLFRTVGIAFLTTQGILWRKDLHPVVVRWEDVKEYRDDHTAYVTIVARGTRSTLGSTEHHVPTRTEADRTGVLGVLAARGVPRIDEFRA